MIPEGLVTGDASIEERVSFCRRELSSAASAHLRADANALYLWGSVLSSDFHQERSDVDVLVLSVEEDRAAVAAMIDDARAVHPLFRRLDVTIVPTSPRGRFREKPFDRIDPLVVFSQLSALQLVWGDQQLAGAVAVAPSSAEVLRLRLRSLRQRLRLHDDDAADEPLCFIVKELGFICHLLHEAAIGVHPFSYSALQTHASDDTRAVVDLVLDYHCHVRPSVDRDTVFAAATALRCVARRVRS